MHTCIYIYKVTYFCVITPLKTQGSQTITILLLSSLWVDWAQPGGPVVSGELGCGCRHLGAQLGWHL